MTQQVELLSARTTSDLVSAINTFIAAEALTLVIQDIVITAHDLARFTGIEYRAEIVYDDTAGETLAAAFTIEAYEDEQLPVLQQDVNAAIAAAPTELWYPVTFTVADPVRRLNKNVAWFLRNADAGALVNIQPGPAAVPKVTSIAFADSPYAASPGETVYCDCTLGVITVTLPPAADFGSEEVTVVKTDVSGNAVTLDPDGAETINGAATDTLAAQYNKITAISDGTELFIKSEV